MKTLYFECFAGISGDMTLGALADLGVPADYLTNELKKLLPHGWTLNFSRVSKNGIGANYAAVDIDEHEHHEHEHEHDHEHHHHEHNSYAEIKKMIIDSNLNENVKKLSIKIFDVVAEAEAKVHGTTVEDVHFHEVGAVDSILDIVGAAVCVDWLKPDKIIFSPISDGHGFTFCQHGKIPVPVPAVAEIFATRKLPRKETDIEKELTTPTGAAIAAALADGFNLPETYVPEKVGYGAGTRDLKDFPNVLRVSWLETQVSPESDKITVIETNIDDATPEILAYTTEKLLENGAKDAFLTPIFMKKGRAAVKLTVLCDKAKEDALTSIIFNETTTIGVRVREERRTVLRRESAEIDTNFGKLKVKRVENGGETRLFPEFDDARRVAQEHNIPLWKVYKLV